MSESDVVSLNCKITALILSLHQAGILHRRQFVGLYQALLSDVKGEVGILEPGQIARRVDAIDQLLEESEKLLNKGSEEPF